MTTFTMPAADIFEALTNTLPHAGTDGDLPVLTAMQVTVESGHVTIVGCDRYSLGIHRTPAADSTDGTFLLPGAAAKVIVKTAKDARNGTVTIAETGGLITASTDSTSASWPAQVGAYPKWRSLLPDGAAPTDPCNIFGFGTVNIGKLLKPVRGFSPVRLAVWKVTAASPTRPFLLEPSWETGAASLQVMLMPVRVAA